MLTSNFDTSIEISAFNRRKQKQTVSPPGIHHRKLFSPRSVILPAEEGERECMEQAINEPPALPAAAIAIHGVVNGLVIRVRNAKDYPNA